MNKFYQTLNRLHKTDVQPHLTTQADDTPLMLFHELVQVFAGRIKWCCERLCLDDDEGACMTRFTTLMAAKELSGISRFPAGTNQADLVKEFKSVFSTAKGLDSAPVALHSTLPSLPNYPHLLLSNTQSLSHRSPSFILYFHLLTLKLVPSLTAIVATLEASFATFDSTADPFKEPETLDR